MTRCTWASCDVNGVSFMAKPHRDYNHSRQGASLWLSHLTDEGIANYETQSFPYAVNPTSPPTIKYIASYLRDQKQASEFAFAVRHHADAKWVGAAGVQFINWKARHATVWITLFETGSESVNTLTELFGILQRYCFVECEPESGCVLGSGLSGRLAGRAGCCGVCAGGPAA